MNKRKIAILIAGTVMMLCVGILYLWSIFLPHVVSHYGWSIADVSMTSAIMIAAFVVGNITAGFVQERVPPRAAALTGSVLFALGLFLSSKADTPAMMYLTYGVMGGIGVGLVYCVVLAVLQKWYAARMGLITGVAVGFFGLSVVILSPVVDTLIKSNGLIPTFQILAGCFFVILVISSLVLKNPAKEYYYAEVTKRIALDNVKQFTPRMMIKSPSYYCIFISTVASSAAYLVIVPFISTIAVSRGLSPQLALGAVMGTGIASATGRILVPIVSEKLGRTNTIIACSLISAAACLLIMSARGAAYVAAVLMIAFTYGGVGGTNPVITTELFGARYSGANYGLVLISIAFSSLLFGKISAALSGGNLTMMFVICAVICAVPIIMMLLLRRRCKRLGKII